MSRLRLRGRYKNKAILNYDPLQITMHARVLGQPKPSFDQPVKTDDVLKFQVVQSPVRSAPGQSNHGTCERGLSN